MRTSHTARLSSSFALAVGGVVVSLASGCGTMSIGRPPSQLDLANDGSPEAQQALRKKHELVYERGVLQRPGALPEDVEREINEEVVAVRTGAWSDEAADWFASSPAASEATDTPVVGFDRFAHSETPTLVIQAGSVLTGTAVGAVLALVNPPANDVTTEISDVANGAFGGALTGFLVSIPLTIVYEWSVPALSTSLAASDYRKGVRAFNADLEARIAKGARAPSAPPAPEPAPTPAPTTDAPPSTEAPATPAVDPEPAKP